jgi:hypothetical protein
MGKLMDLTGKTFGKLTVIRLAGKHPTTPRKYLWECTCECGSSKEVCGTNLSIGKTKSCGCLVGKNSTHGESESREYRIWRGILERCYNKSSASYPRYGGRGIDVCEMWRTDFSSFLSDMGRRPSKSHSIDRIDNSKGYSKDNCRWATPLEQANNTRRNISVEVGGETYVSIAEAARSIGLPYDKLHYMMRTKGYELQER